MQGPVITLQPKLVINDIIKLQNMGKKLKWFKKEGKTGHDKVWRSQSGHMAAPRKLLGLLMTDAHDFNAQRGEVWHKICDKGF